MIYGLSLSYFLANSESSLQLNGGPFLNPSKSGIPCQATRAFMLRSRSTSSYLNKSNEVFKSPETWQALDGLVST